MGSGDKVMLPIHIIPGLQSDYQSSFFSHISPQSSVKILTYQSIVICIKMAQ